VFTASPVHLCDLQTLMWLVTGQECYARNAADIFLAWAAVNQTNKGANAPLVSDQQ
jgi:hypothetical protein